MKKYFVIALILLMNIPTFLVGTVEAQSLKELRAKRESAKLSKLAPDLEVLLADDDEEERQALAGGKTREEIKKERRARAAKLATEEGDDAPGRSRVNGVLLPSSEVLAEEKQSFIVQASPATPETVIEEKLALLGGRIKHKSGSSNLLVIEAPRSAIRQIAVDASIGYISPDRLVKPQGHLENATGTEQIRGLVSGTAINGQGIGVAILDSGIDEVHKLVMPSVTHPGVVYRKDFTGQQITSDLHGHGTHVASLTNGDYLYKIGKYEGIAPGTKIINLRVLDSNGVGSASAVIAALDWCVANKNLVVNGVSLNLRVINLSLGSIAKDSYVNDPLCLAARRAHNAGIVVVAAAGNDGKSLSGQKVYGGIHSPGIEPSVITVGAANTFGTDARSDDQVTTYSSRGPTRGYTVVNGIRKYDNLIKPDIVAPGNRLISTCSFSSWTNPQSLVNLYPTLPLSSSQNEDQLMYLSGTSMAAPVVAGAAALMLQANPNLTPSLVKAILMYSAQPLAGANMLEQGAGLLNVDGALRLAKLVKPTLPSTVGTALLTTTLPTQQSTIAGQTFNWGQGVITNWGFLTGPELMTKWQSIYGSGQVLGDATIFSNNIFSIVTGRTSTAVILKSGAFTITTSGQVLGDGAVLADSKLLANGQVLSDGQVLGDGAVLADGQVLSDGTTRSDTTLKSASSSSILGDNTACMLP